MIPGEILCKEGDIELNAGRPTLQIGVKNTGDRPIQVGSHYHFYEVNEALQLFEFDGNVHQPIDRERVRGMRLDIAAGTAKRFEPSDKVTTVNLVPYGGRRVVIGFQGKINGPL